MGAPRAPRVLRARGGGVRHRLLVDRHPGPEQGLPGTDDLRLLRGRQARDRPVRQPEPHQRSALGRPAARAGRDDRRRGPHLRDQQGHRPEGHPPGRVQQRARRLDAGRLHDHPAVRQGPLPVAGAHHHPQGEGGVRLAEDPAAGVQGRDPPGLPQHHLLRSWRLRRPGRRPGLLRQGRQGPDRPGGRRPRVDPELTERVRPGRRHQQPAAPARPLPVRPRRHGEHGQPRPRQGRPAQAAAAAVPPGEERGQVRRPTGPRADAGEERAAQARLHRPGDLRRRAQGRHHVHPQRDGRGPPGCPGAAAQGPQGPARGRRLGRPEDRCAQGLLRRPGLPEEPDQLRDAHRRIARLGVQAVRSRGRHRRRSRATRRTPTPTAGTRSSTRDRATATTTARRSR